MWQLQITVNRVEIQVLKFKIFFKMSRQNTLKFGNSYLVFFVLLLLTLVPAQGSWCFQGGDAVMVPDTLMTDCHLVPSVCLTSSNMPMDQGQEATPADCNECLDLSFEEVVSLCSQDSISDIVFAPGISYFQFPSVVLLEGSHSHALFSHVKRPLKASLNLHRSIQSTVLII